MKITPKSILKIAQDREYSIEARVSFMFVSIGIIASIFGVLLCIAVGAEWIATVAVVLISVVTALTTLMAQTRTSLNRVRNTIVILLMVVMPIIYCGAGGMNSGCPAWLIYSLLFITLACKGTMLIVCLSISMIVDIALFILDFVGVPFIHHLENDTNRFVSISGSCFLVAVAIIITVIFYKQMYNQERIFLEEKSEELERANEFERDFLATMSHELRTPINAIIGFNELILNESEDDQIVSYSEDVKNSSIFLLSLINDILDYSKIEAGKMTLVKDSYSVEDMISRCYNVVANRAEDNGLQLVVKADPSLPSMLYGDENRISQIIINLLTNAIKYTEDGVVSFSISSLDSNITTNDSGNKVCRLYILITDTGIGIEKDNIDLIFNSFKRVNNIKNKQIEGTGLGLAIVKSLLELMDGSINVESVVGVGSKFMVTIDQPIVEASPIGQMEFSLKKRGERVSKSRQAPIPTNVPAPKPAEDDGKPTVLAVDDTDTNLRVIKMLLKNEPYKVVTVNNGADAVDLANNNDYAVILMDIMMPKMSGVEALEKIRIKKPNVPIIALTADAVTGAREEYLRKGFNDYLTKPVNSEKLKYTISKYLNKEEEE